MAAASGTAPASASEAEGSMVAALVRELRLLPAYWLAKHSARAEVVQAQLAAAGGAGDLKAVVLAFLKASGQDAALRSDAISLLVRHRAQATTAPGLGVFPRGYTPDEPFDYLRAAQARLAREVVKRVSSLASTSKIPFSRKRFLSTKDSRRSIAEFVDTLKDDPFSPRVFLYDAEDLLGHLADISNPNCAPEGIGFECKADPRRALAWQPRGRIKVSFRTKDLAEYRRQFAPLGAEHRQIGVDDDLFPGSVDAFLDSRMKLGTKVAETSLLAAKEYCQHGCPMGNRGEVWFTALCANYRPSYAVYYDQLHRDVKRYDMLVDRLLIAEARYAASGDVYFVFEDTAKEILLAFSRDVQLLSLGPRLGMPVAQGTSQDAAGEEAPPAIYPPNGVLPYRGLGFLVMPICYCFEDTGKLYHVFRELYLQHFVHLHTISSHPQSILRLALQFERLMEAHQARLSLHLADIGVDALAIALPWMCTAFAGYLDLAETLALWDRIIGFHDLSLLPLLAVAVFAFRRTALLKAPGAAEAKACMKDLKGLRAIPLIQFCLFGR